MRRGRVGGGIYRGNGKGSVHVVQERRSAAVHADWDLDLFIGVKGKRIRWECSGGLVSLWSE